MDQEKHNNPEMKKRPPVRYDENGNPIPPKKRPPVRYDENGNPIPPKKRPPVRYDENGNPIPPKKRPPVRYDENGNPIPPKKRPPVRYDENGNPIPPRRPQSNGAARANGYDRFKENEHMLLDRGELKAESAAKDEKDTKKKRNIFGYILVGLQALVSVIFMVLVFLVDILPMKYVLAAGGVFLILWAFAAISQKFRGTRILGKIFAIIMILVLTLGSVYLWKAHDVMDELTTGQEYVVTEMAIVVRQDSAAAGLQDLDGGTFGILATMNREQTDDTMANLEGQYSTGVIKVEYEGFLEQVRALYDGSVDAIVMNEAFRDIILETYPDFNTATRVLDAFTHKEEVKKEEKPKKEVNVSEEPFTVFLSGNDSYGTVSLADGRTDVNILATVNPKTKQILLTTTPRDYYVVQPVYGSRDKLTHAGLWGVDCSMETLENLYDIEIDYYARVNFSGFRDIIDALDGVEVYSDYAFTTSDGQHYFDYGYNYVYGEAALSFVRERYAFAAGDAQRGRNQMAMIQAIINKITSPAILTNYMDLMSSLSSCFITDIPRGKISDLVKMQLDEGGSWNIVSYTVAGATGSEYCPALGAYASIMYENEEAIAEAKALMQAVADGEIISDPQAASAE